MQDDYAAARNPLLLTISAAILVFLAAPLLILVIQSLTAEDHLSFPPAAFGVRWYLHIAKSGPWLEAGGRSLLIAAIVAPIAVVIGTAAALAIERGPASGRAALYTLLISPMILPHVVLALGFFRLVLMLNADDSYAAICVAHLIVSVPYIVVTVSASLQTLDHSLEEAALNLGASEWRAFLHVILPALVPGLVAGAVFAFIESFDEFIMTFFITTFRLTLPIQIFNSLAYQLDPSVAAVSSAALTMTMLLTGCLLVRGQVVAAGRIVR